MLDQRHNTAISNMHSLSKYPTSRTGYDPRLLTNQAAMWFTAIFVISAHKMLWVWHKICAQLRSLPDLGKQPDFVNGHQWRISSSCASSLIYLLRLNFSSIFNMNLTKKLLFIFSNSPRISLTYPFKSDSGLYKFPGINKPYNPIQKPFV
jgi:hypothetical protein